MATAATTWFSNQAHIFLLFRANCLTMMIVESNRFISTFFILKRTNEILKQIQQHQQYQQYFYMNINIYTDTHAHTLRECIFYIYVESKKMERMCSRTGIWLKNEQTEGDIYYIMSWGLRILHSKHWNQNIKPRSGDSFFFLKRQ